MEFGCTDTDGGLNYFEVGEATNMKREGLSGRDICLKDNQTPSPGTEEVLFEKYCGEGGLGYTEVFNCPTSCFDGACRSLSMEGIEINPLNGKEGTIFTFKVEIESALEVSLAEGYVHTEGGEVLENIFLYDDGAHGDEEANDEIYGGIFDSTGIVDGNYIVDFYVEDGEGGSFRRNDLFEFIITPDNCVSVIENGHPDDKIDVIFLPDFSYNDLDVFASDVIKHIDVDGNNFGILATEPFKSNADKFNFYKVNQLGSDVKCGWLEIKEDGTRVKHGKTSRNCGNPAKLLASQCPSVDMVVVMVKKGIYGWANPFSEVGVLVTAECDGTETYVPEGYWDRECHIPRDFPGFYTGTTVHELGHLFGLQDEYGRIGGAHIWGPNCDVAGCPNWCDGEPEQAYTTECHSLEQSECKDNGDCIWLSEVNSYFNSQCINYIDRDGIDIGNECLEGTGCYHGCLGGGAWRASTSCIMQGGKAASFDPVDMRHLNSYLEGYN